MYQEQPFPKYKSRPKLYWGVSAPLWSGTLAAALVLAGVLYCLLTHRIPL